MSARELWRRGQEGWPRRYPVAQFPNAPLIVAFAGWGVAAATDGPAHDAGRAVFLGGLAVWGALELASGVNGFRRLIGAGGLAWVVVNVARAL